MEPEKKPGPSKLEMETPKLKAKLVKPVKPELIGIDLVEAYGGELICPMPTMIS